MSDNRDGRIFTNENCTGCNRCISACTVPEANIAVLEDGANKIHIDARHCINCAKCIEACPHGARDYTDDTEAFLNDLMGGKDIAVLIAPAVRSNFPGFKRLLGLLRKLGARTIYDTSFGADICTWGYIRYIQKNNKKGLISQPCPAVVNYIEKHNPDLIGALAPVHSPAMCSAIYMRKYRGIQSGIAFLSPCIAKKDEFEDPNTGGMVQYNVTFRKLAQALGERGLDYRSAPEAEFDNDQHGLGSVYPMPGGLKKNVHKIIPGAWVHQVEGQPEVRHFLDEYRQQLRQMSDTPLLVDILNCAKGCNLGTGALCTGSDLLGVDQTMYKEIQAASAKPGKGFRRKKTEAAGHSLAEFDKQLRLEDFIRSYSGKLVESVRVTPANLEAAYTQLLKSTQKSREINCCSCGYNTCREMATAIAKGINHAENCVEYHKSMQVQQRERIEEMLQRQEQNAKELKRNVERIFGALSENARKSDSTTQRVTRITDEVEAMKEIAVRLGDVVEVLNTQLQQYVNMGTQIVSISTMTKLLSINASVEAAHAKDLGKGFAVVASQMKNLSDQSADSANEIISSNDLVFPILDEVRSISEVLNSRAGNIASSTGEILHSMRAISETEQEITGAASRILSENMDG